MAAGGPSKGVTVFGHLGKQEENERAAELQFRDQVVLAVAANKLRKSRDDMLKPL